MISEATRALVSLIRFLCPIRLSNPYSGCYVKIGLYIIRLYIAHITLIYSQDSYFFGYVGRLAQDTGCEIMNVGHVRYKDSIRSFQLQCQEGLCGELRNEGENRESRFTTVEVAWKEIGLASDPKQCQEGTDKSMRRKQNSNRRGVYKQEAMNDVKRNYKC